MNLHTLAMQFLHFLLAGCSVGGLTTRLEIDVEIFNRSSRDLENAKAHFGENACEWGRLVKGATAGYGFYPEP
jgi:hypothetical protein